MKYQLPYSEMILKKTFFVMILTFAVSWSHAFSKKPDAKNLEGRGAYSDGVSLSSVQIRNSDISMSTDKVQQILSDKVFIDFLKNNVKLNEAFIEITKKDADPKKAVELIKQWVPDNKSFEDYKEFFIVKWQGQGVDSSTETTQADHAKVEFYKKLKKEKKFIRLRVDLLTTLLRQDLKQTQPFVDFMIKESRLMIRQLRGSSEGENLESLYLNWLKKNQFYSEICSTEKNRWFSEVTINLKELTDATQKCPIRFEDFQTRLRRLLFAAKEKQAQDEVDQFAKFAQLEKWEHVYLQAIYNSNTGDPALAFRELNKFEGQLLKSDFSENYFYIAQRAGELVQAERIIEAILRDTKNTKQYKEMKFQQGFLFYQTRKYDKAYTVFNSLYNQSLKNKRTKIRRYSKELDQIAWLRAWTLYLDGKYELALKAFEETKAYANDQARLAYWIADTHLKMGFETTAIAEFRRLADPLFEQKSFSFYNLLAWLRFDKLKQDYKPDEVFKSLALLAKMNRFPYPIASDDLTYSQIIKSYSFFDQDTFETDDGEIQVVNSENSLIENSEAAGVEIDNQNDLQIQTNWAKFLITQGEPDLARWHLYEIEKKVNTKKKAEYLAQFYLEHQFYYRSLSLMNRFAVLNKATLSLKAEPQLWASLFPEAYKDQVFKYAEKRKIDPYLILSIMRAETQYKSDAISPVGAVGLMQFMPYSAQKVSKLMNQEIQTDELFKPEKSIDYGATYLKKLSVELDYQKPLVAAAYNGGPHRVKSWLKNIGAIEFDKFIEHIPFAETRTYVKRVLTFRATYDKLYSKSIDSDKYKYLLQPIPNKTDEPFALKEEWDQFKDKL